MKRTPEQLAASLARSEARAVKLEAALAKRREAARIAYRKAGIRTRTRQGAVKERQIVKELAPLKKQADAAKAEAKKAAKAAAQLGPQTCDEAIDQWLASKEGKRAQRGIFKKYGRCSDDEATRFVAMVVEAIKYGVEIPEWRVVVLGIVQLALTRDEATTNVADLSQRAAASGKKKGDKQPAKKPPHKKERERCRREIVFGVKDLDGDAEQEEDFSDDE